MGDTADGGDEVVQGRSAGWPAERSLSLFSSEESRAHHERDLCALMVPYTCFRSLVSRVVTRPTRARSDLHHNSHSSSLKASYICHRLMALYQ
jgi:hypothetical protein